MQSEVLATTKSTEEQLDAIQRGVSDAIAQHMEQTAAVVGVTNGRISDVVEELEAKIADVKRGDGSGGCLCVCQPLRRFAWAPRRGSRTGAHFVPVTAQV